MHTTQLLLLALLVCSTSCRTTGLDANDTLPTTKPHGGIDLGPGNDPIDLALPDIEYPIYPVDFASPPDASDLVQSCAVSSDCAGTGQVCCIVPSSGVALYECLALSDCLAQDDVVACRSSDDCTSSGQGACCKGAGPDHCCME